MSGGHLEIEVLPGGSIVPAFETLDAVHKKVLDGGHTAAAFWMGRNRAAVLFGSTPGGPFGMDVMDYIGLNRNQPWSKAMYRLLSATPSPYARKSLTRKLERH